MGAAVACADMQPDRRLLDRMAAGDVTAGSELERRYWKTAYALAYGLVLDSRRAERSVDEAFEVVRRAAASGLKYASFPLWLSEVVRACVRASLRSRRAGTGAGVVQYSKQEAADG
jgi:hypothetical protein